MRENTKNVRVCVCDNIWFLLLSLVFLYICSRYSEIFVVWLAWYFTAAYIDDRAILDLNEKVGFLFSAADFPKSVLLSGPVVFNYFKRT